MNKEAAIISIRNGITRHPDHRMAEPVNLDIYLGEQIAILGPNGAGKTRLVEIITGRWPLLGDAITYNFGDEALVSDNIKYLAFRDSYGDSSTTYYYQQRWNQHDIDDDMPRVDGKPIIALSSGELRKYQLRKALQSNPRLLILDAPFIGLDVHARKELRDTLADLIQRTGLQVILVLSRPSDIPDFINRIIFVENKNLSSTSLPKHTQPSSFRPRLAVLPRTGSLPPTGGAGEGPGEGPGEGLPILRFSHVTIRYGSRTILNDLSWTVNQGEHWALSGDNGSGKSTLLSLVCADNPQAYACDIELFGHQRGSGESIWEIKRHIGYVSPEMHRAYQKDLPAIDIVASGLHDSVGLYVRPRPEQRETCLEWMRRFGIEELADRTFLSLSSGEQRMCLLARAFVKSPDLLILDEPFHGLDDQRRLLATSIIEDYCKDPSRTLIIVSHYEEELPACITHHLKLTNSR